MTARLLVAGLVAALTLGPAMADEREAGLQAALDTVRAAYGFPGATAAIAWPDGRVMSVATGLADVEAELPMTPETPMLAASIGKSFAALVALSLETEGLLARDERVSEHLGGRDWYARLPNHAEMTVGDLMRHTAGLPDHVHLARFAADMAARVASGADAPAPEAAIAYALDTEPLFPAGAGWHYSDTGYLLLGLVIEAAAERPYYDLVTERLLAPLGLDRTARSDRRVLPGLAVGYATPGNAFGLPSRTMDAEGRLIWDPAMEWTGGGLVSTSADLARWGHALFGGTALAAPYLDRLLDAVPVSPGAPGVLYGAGVAIHADTPRGPVHGHGGWIPGYVSSLRHYPDHGVTVAFQINTDRGIADDSSDVVPVLEAALADFAISALR